MKEKRKAFSELNARQNEETYKDMKSHSLTDAALELQRFTASMINETKTEQYVLASHTMILCHDNYSDISSSLRVLKERYPSTCHVCTVSEDLLLSGRDVSESEWYKDCRIACQRWKNIVIVHGSNLSFEDIQRVVYLAIEAKYQLLIIPSFSKTESDTLTGIAEDIPSFLRNTKTPEAIVHHISFGYYLNRADSRTLRDEAWACLVECWNNVPEFQETYSRLCSSEDIVSRYGLNAKESELGVLHCDTKICGYHTASAYNYLKNTPAGKMYGHCDTLYISGFVVSPNIVAATVRVTYRQRELWDSQDLQTRRVPSLYHAVDHLAHIERVAKLSLLDSNRFNESGTATMSKDSKKKPNEDLRNRGTIPHMILGKTESTTTLNLLFDVSDAKREETMSMSVSASVGSDDEQTPRVIDQLENKAYNIGNVTARRYGSFWIMTLREVLEVTALFASSCIPPCVM